MGKIIRCVVPVVVLAAWLMPGRPALSLSCPHHKVCAFSDPNIAGQQLNISDRTHRLNPKLGNQMNDQTSSWVNNTPYAVSFYEDIDGGGIR